MDKIKYQRIIKNTVNLVMRATVKSEIDEYLKNSGLSKNQAKELFDIALRIANASYQKTGKIFVTAGVILNLAAIAGIIFIPGWLILKLAFSALLIFVGASAFKFGKGFLQKDVENNYS